jgi:hypothetical protein
MAHQTSKLVRDEKRLFAGKIYVQQGGRGRMIQLVFSRL